MNAECKFVTDIIKFYGAFLVVGWKDFQSKGSCRIIYSCIYTDSALKLPEDICYENGEPRIEEPNSIQCVPVSLLSQELIDLFENKWAHANLFPEVGNKGFIREFEFQEKGCRIIQLGVYRFNVFHPEGKIYVQVVLRIPLV